MRFISILSGISIGLLAVAGCSSEPKASSAATSGAADQAAWAVTMDNIEACSCPTFCQCYFSAQPALHEQGDRAMRYCRFNNAFRVTHGHYGPTSLDGMKFWMAGDLGGDFSKGQMEWAVLRFEPSATPQQREAAQAIVKAVFPVKWNSFSVGPDAKIDWQKNSEMAVAKLNDGKSAEIVLKTTKGQNGKPVVIQNAEFWAAQTGDTYVMGNEVEAYRDGDKPFEFKGTNGFVNVVRMTSNDVKSQGHASASASKKLLQAGGAGSCDADCCK